MRCENPPTTKPYGCHSPLRIGRIASAQRSIRSIAIRSRREKIHAPILPNNPQTVNISPFQPFSLSAFQFFSFLAF